LDPTAEPGAPVPDDWQPGAPTSALTFAAEAVWDLVSSPVGAAQAVARSLATPRQLSRVTLETARGALALTGAVRPVHDTTLTGPLSGSRRYVWTDLSISDIRT